MDQIASIEHFLGPGEVAISSEVAEQVKDSCPLRGLGPQISRSEATCEESTRTLFYLGNLELKGPSSRRLRGNRRKLSREDPGFCVIACRCKGSGTCSRCPGQASGCSPFRAPLRCTLPHTDSPKLYLMLQTSRMLFPMVASLSECIKYLFDTDFTALNLTGCLQGAPEATVGGIEELQHKGASRAVTERSEGVLRAHLPDPISKRLEAGLIDFIAEIRVCTILFIGFPSLKASFPSFMHPLLKCPVS